MWRIGGKSSKTHWRTGQVQWDDNVCFINNSYVFSVLKILFNLFEITTIFEDLNFNSPQVCHLLWQPFRLHILNFPDLLSVSSFLSFWQCFLEPFLLHSIGFLTIFKTTDYLLLCNSFFWCLTSKSSSSLWVYYLHLSRKKRSNHLLTTLMTVISDWLPR